MKRAKNLFPILISDENIERAIDQVNRTHRWARGEPNGVTVWVEKTKAERAKELREIILNGFEPSPARHKRRYDQSAGKWRDIWEPLQWPDQYIHHMIVQVLQPVMMRGMDYWCCGSIKGRGTQRGIKGLDKWIRKDPKNTKYAAELDVYHFYESLTPKAVMDRMRRLVKDEKILDVIWRLDKGRPILFKTAAGLLSRIGQLKHCDSYYLRKRYIRPGFQKILKNIVRAEMKRRKEKMTWPFNTCLAT